MAVNESKRNDPRFRKRWLESGATAIIVPVEEPLPGSHIDDYIARMLGTIAEIRHTSRYQHRLIGCFNDIKIVVVNKSTPESVVAAWEESQKKQSRKFWASPKGLAIKRREREGADRLQQVCINGIQRLKDLNFADYGAVLDWIYEIRDCSDDRRVNHLFPVSIVLETFKSHGYEADVNLKEDLRKDNPENVARYIIGQAIDCLEKVGSMHQVIGYFIDDWREKFRGELTAA